MSNTYLNNNKLTKKVLSTRRLICMSGRYLPYIHFPTDREKFTPYTLHTYVHRYYVLRWKDEQRSLRPAN